MFQMSTLLCERGSAVVVGGGLGSSDALTSARCCVLANRKYDSSPSDI